MVDRTTRAHVLQRMKENEDAIAKGDKVPNNYWEPQAASIQLRYYHSYKDGVLKDTPEPETMDNETLLEQLECFSLDSSRYSRPGDEQNFLIMAYASEWFRDIREEILKRLNKGTHERMAVLERENANLKKHLEDDRYCAKHGAEACIECEDRCESCGYDALEEDMVTTAKGERICSECHAVDLEELDDV